MQEPHLLVLHCYTGALHVKLHKQTYLFIFVTGHVSIINVTKKVSQCHAFTKYIQIDFCQLVQFHMQSTHCCAFFWGLIPWIGTYEG